jgi:hypothetical protein
MFEKISYVWSEPNIQIYLKFKLGFFFEFQTKKITKKIQKFQKKINLKKKIKLIFLKLIFNF